MTGNRLMHFRSQIKLPASVIRERCLATSSEISIETTDPVFAVDTILKLHVKKGSCATCRERSGDSRTAIAAHRHRSGENACFDTEIRRLQTMPFVIGVLTENRLGSSESRIQNAVFYKKVRVSCVVGQMPWKECHQRM